MAALATWAPEDGTLGAVAPLALACAAGTALVVDLDPAGPRYPGRTLAQLVADGPTRDDLTPRRRGVAVLANGGLGCDGAAAVLDALLAGWPDVVLRLPSSGARFGAIPLVPIRMLSPFLDPVSSPAVYQRSVWRIQPPGPGVVLPRPQAPTIRALASGKMPGTSRWLRAWAQVWERPWD